MTTTNSFEVGNVVRLNSGSPKLTVVAIAGPENVKVSWHRDDGQISSTVFPASCLTLVSCCA
jgi:uncharacterized protein YodC (DUF2158 family)